MIMLIPMTAAVYQTASDLVASNSHLIMLIDLEGQQSGRDTVGQVISAHDVLGPIWKDLRLGWT